FFGLVLGPMVMQCNTVSCFSQRPRNSMTDPLAACPGNQGYARLGRLAHRHELLLREMVCRAPYRPTKGTQWLTAALLASPRSDDVEPSRSPLAGPTIPTRRSHQRAPRLSTRSNPGSSSNQTT